MRTQIINDLMTNIFFNLIETEDRIAADERFEGLSSNDALEIYKVLSDQLIRTHIYAAHIGSGISSRRVSPIEEIPHLEPEDIIAGSNETMDVPSFSGITASPRRSILKPTIRTLHSNAAWDCWKQRGSVISQRRYETTDLPLYYAAV